MFSNIFAQAWKFAVVGVIAFLIGSVVNTTVTGSVAVTNLPTVQDVQLGRIDNYMLQITAATRCSAAKK